MLNQIFNEDCLEGMKRIPDGSIDCIITDPPYGTTACKWDTIIPFDLMWEQLKRIIKPNGAIVLFGSEPFSSYLRLSNIDWYKYDWIWNKKVGSNIFNLKKQPLKIHETISIFNGFNYYPIMEKKDKPQVQGKYKTIKNGSDVTNKKAKQKLVGKIYTHSYPKSILIYDKDKRSTKQFHPTQKPVALIEYLIKTYTNEGETVLDFTIGSGTTAIACINTNRNYIGFELDKGYFDIANERIAGKLQNKE